MSATLVACLLWLPAVLSPAQKARIDALAAEGLAARQATTAADLVPGAPRRRLGIGEPRTLEHTGGRTLLADMVLEAGPPSQLRVPTRISFLVGIALASDGSVTSVGLPSRADLATAVALALEGEAKAFAAAVEALDRAHVARSPRFRSWSAALDAVHLDPRLPRETYAGAPSWHVFFGPYEESRGGWTTVLLDADTFRVTSVNGRDP